ncbi:ABC-three component system middle component 6 [Burkholderia cepacia]|uniref:ABC-three component system middle component 6 n=1 Tax=Burkholderia cepacia TaxID=292 RepID=UPI002AB62773|nr:ABC-three component system middle component 6 [Burkholderia cepacia]
MILPTKHVRPDRALIGVGAEVLAILKRPMTISRLWDEVRGRRSLHSPTAPIDYQWFVLSLDLLYTIGALDFDRGIVRRAMS